MNLNRRWDLKPVKKIQRNMRQLQYRISRDVTMDRVRKSIKIISRYVKNLRMVHDCLRHFKLYKHKIVQYNKIINQSWINNLWTTSSS